MRRKKTFYLTKQADETLKKICIIENRNQSNMIVRLINTYKQ